MKRVLITAMHDVFSQKLAEILIAENFIVRTIAKNTPAGSFLLKLPIELFPASLLDEHSLVDAVKGCDYLVHTDIPHNEIAENFTVRDSYLERNQWLANAGMIASKQVRLTLSTLSPGIKSPVNIFSRFGAVGQKKTCLPASRKADAESSRDHTGLTTISVGLGYFTNDPDTLEKISKIVRNVLLEILPGECHVIGEQLKHVHSRKYRLSNTMQTFIADAKKTLSFRPGLSQSNVRRVGYYLGWFATIHLNTFYEWLGNIG